MMKVMLAFKTAEIESAISSLDSKSQDVLMKYIYRGFEVPSNGSSAQLLTWHQKVNTHFTHSTVQQAILH